MAFWGIELKPGKPFTHRFDDSKGRLHVSMASLGLGSAVKKSVLQCNVGTKSPVFLCSLFPEKSESLQLNLEFEEVDEVVFSVIGPRSIHLSGYYLGGGRFRGQTEESESYGEDIADTDTENLESNDDDEYEGSFINDDDPGTLSPSLVSSAGEEHSDDKIKRKKGNRRRRLRKTYQLSESDDEGCSHQKNISNGPVLASDDDDNCPISLYMKTGANAKKGIGGPKNDNKGIDQTSNKKAENHDSGSKRNVDDLAVDEQPVRQSDLPVEPLLPSEVGCKKVEKNGLQNGGENDDNGIDDTNNKKEANYGNGDTESKRNIDDPAVGHNNAGTPRKKRKQRNENDRGEGDETCPSELKVDTHFNAGGGQIPNVAVDLAQVNDERPKKKNRKEQSFDAGISQSVNGVKENQGEQDDAKEDSKSEGKKVKKKKKKKKKKNSEKAAENGEAINSEQPRLQIEENNTSVNPKSAATSQVQSLQNGLVIEVIESGKVDGKVAVSGSKVSLRYVGKLKKTGEVIDSNVDDALFKFRLGSGKVIEGWEVGIEGMRVSEKRRLTIPPEMSYGDEGNGKNVPPNSWLVYEVELVKVRD